MRVVLEQMNEQSFTLDYDRMAAALGEGITKNAVKHRWYKLKKNLIGGKAAGGRYFSSCFQLSRESLPSHCFIYLDPQFHITTHIAHHTFQITYIPLFLHSIHKQDCCNIVLGRNPHACYPQAISRAKIRVWPLAQAIGYSLKHAAQCRMWRFRARLAVGTSSNLHFHSLISLDAQVSRLSLTHVLSISTSRVFCFLITSILTLNSTSTLSFYNTSHRIHQRSSKHNQHHVCHRRAHLPPRYPGATIPQDRL